MNVGDKVRLRDWVACPFHLIDLVGVVIEDPTMRRHDDPLLIQFPRGENKYEEEEEEFTYYPEDDQSYFDEDELELV